MHKTQELIKHVTSAYESLLFHRVFHTIYNFCTVEMSAFYLDILKDRSYTFAKKSKERRAGQTVMYSILLNLVKLSAPILVHTAEEVWSAIIHKDEDAASVHLAAFSKENPAWTDNALHERWEKLINMRADIARELEKMRAAKLIGNSLEASVNLSTEKAAAAPIAAAFQAMATAKTDAAEPAETRAIGFAVPAGPASRLAFENSADAPSCHECGSLMVRGGACYKCLNCGATSGCS